MTRTGTRRGRVVFADFGKKRIWTLKDEDKNVAVFNNLLELVESLRPSMLVFDSLPRGLERTAAELVGKITILRLRDLGKIAEERRKNGIRKSNEGDVKILREIYRQHPELFEPMDLDMTKLRGLTELWWKSPRNGVGQKCLKATDNKVVSEIYNCLRKVSRKLSCENHREALRPHLYKRVCE